MSSFHEAEIACPRCKASQSVEIWGSVNVTLSPDLKGPLVKGELNVFRCNKCGIEIEILNYLLYHDIDKQVMIWLMYLEEDGHIPVEVAPPTEDLFPQLPREYRFRIVKSRREFVEKILIFDDELDDRIIEVLKLHVASKSSSENIEIGEGLYYNGIEQKKIVFVLLCKEGNSMTCSITMDDGYLHDSAFLQSQLEETLEEKGTWLIVDQDYALEIVRNVNAGEHLYS
jgi:hypothetical protein